MRKMAVIEPHSRDEPAAAGKVRKKTARSLAGAGSCFLSENLYPGRYWPIMPPSTVYRDAVTNDASSDKRKFITAATSCGSP